MKDDFISRAAALKGLEDLNIASFYELNEHSKEAYTEVKAMLKALPSAQPGSEDAVSRFEVLRLIDYSSHDLNDAVDNRYMQNEIKQLPSVTPKQPGWIPVTEKLPKDDGDYLVTKKSFGWNCKEYIEIDIARYENKDGWHKADTVLAWCELPKPWEGGQDEQN